MGPRRNFSVGENKTFYNFIFMGHPNDQTESINKVYLSIVKKCQVINWLWEALEDLRRHFSSLNVGCVRVRSEERVLMISRLDLFRSKRRDAGCGIIMHADFLPGLPDGGSHTEDHSRFAEQLCRWTMFYNVQPKLSSLWCMLILSRSVWGLLRTLGWLINQIAMAQTNSWSDT